MIRAFATLVVFIFFGLGAAVAQQGQDDAVWVQIEALPSLREAQDRAQVYTDYLADVNGFQLRQGWYAIVLGPYARSDAEQVLRVYRIEGQIPQDSFIALPGALGQQFWPIGASAQAPATQTAPVESPEQTQTAVQSLSDLPDETVAEARQSERLLTAEERKGLQIALQAAGFYNSAIDGAFGAGTRRSMADWQYGNGFQETGVLTTKQRKILMDDYNAPLISVGMKRHADRDAGIEMDLPLEAVAFSRYEAPFAHFDSASDLGVRVLLISQQGDQATLRGLFDVMQSLEIVPLDGPREFSRDSFTLEGRGKGIVSYTQAGLQDGQIKGFTLVWPDGDEARRARVLASMKASFTRLGGVLADSAGVDDGQSIDLMAGLNIRKPRLSRSGFFVDASGTVATVSEVTEGCARITLNDDHVAEVIGGDTSLGVALLRPTETLAPMSVAQFVTATPRLQSEVAVAGFSYEGALGSPTLTYGKLADIRGLDGNARTSRLELEAQSGDAGGPVFDQTGAVLGMLLPDPKTGQTLPVDVSLAAASVALETALADKGLSPQAASGAESVTPNELLRRALGMTVLVSCWD